MKYPHHYPCPLADRFPTCAGEIDPALCAPVADQTLIDRSKYYSSLQGWPAPPAASPSPPWVANHRLVAPAGCLDCPRPHEGRGRKPWDSGITATIAHLNTPEPLALVVELLRLQAERPYILVVDTGSDPAACGRLEGLRADDLEVHYLRSHAWRHSSEPVAAACDLAMDLCQTDLLFFTHSDCFPVARDLLTRLAGRCSSRNPLVGYRLTEREDMDDWRWMVGHTCLMIHWPTAVRVGAHWGRRTVIARGDLPAASPYDTEYGFNWAFRNAGISADLIGTERNFVRNTNDDFDHVRSFATANLYPWVGAADYRANLHRWMHEAMEEARARIARWQKPRIPLGERHPGG
jgi:hypothetical protein